MEKIVNRLRTTIGSLAIGLSLLTTVCSKSTPESSHATDNVPPPNNGVSNDASDHDGIVSDDAAVDSAVPIDPLPPPTNWKSVTPALGSSDQYVLMPEIAAAYVTPDGSTPYVVLVGSMTPRGGGSATPSYLVTIEQQALDSLAFGPAWQGVNASNSMSNSVSAFGPTASYSGNMLSIVWRNDDSEVNGVTKTNGSWGKPFDLQGGMSQEGALVTQNPRAVSPTFTMLIVGTNGADLYWIQPYPSVAYTVADTWPFGNPFQSTRKPWLYGLAAAWTPKGLQLFGVVKIRDAHQLFWLSCSVSNSCGTWSTATQLLTDTDAGKVPAFDFNVQSAPAAVWCGDRTIVVARDELGNVWQTTSQDGSHWTAKESVGAIPGAMQKTADAAAPLPPYPSPAMVSRTSTNTNICHYEIYITADDHTVWETTATIP